ncbi:MAG: 50S ribosomal protein L23 [Pseudomonadota bacterium]
MSHAVREERLMTILLGPHMSEKSLRINERANQVVFKVRTDATKPEIKAAVEKLFEVAVEGVTVLNQDGKVKRRGRGFGRRSSFKKAYVKLAAGSEIDFLGAE